MTDITTGTTTSALSTSIAPDLTVIDGKVTTTSLQIAEHFGKTHKSVLRAIRNLECSPQYHQRNFAPMVHDVEIGSGAIRKDESFQITRDGFTFLAMGFTGKEAAQWKEAYIETFNRMEAALTQPQAIPTTITPAQCQHLRELVQIVVESGKQSHGETWNRLHRKMKVNSYKELTPDKFDAACQYLQSKMDGQSMAALVQKHFPKQLALEASKTPVGASNMVEATTTPPTFEKPQWFSVTVDWDYIVGLIQRRAVPREALLAIAQEATQALYVQVCSDGEKGEGAQITSRLKGMAQTDLKEVANHACLELWMRAGVSKRPIPTQWATA